MSQAAPRMVGADFKVSLSVDADKFMLGHTVQRESWDDDEVVEKLRQLILELLGEWQLRTGITSSTGVVIQP